MRQGGTEMIDAQGLNHRW